MTERVFFTQIPNLVDDAGLSVYAYRLYGHLRRVAGEDGSCWESTVTLARKCGISQHKISDAKRELQAKGLIQITDSKNYHWGNALHLIKICDVWAENGSKYACSPQEQTSSPQEYISSQGEQTYSPGAMNQEPINKIPSIKNTRTTKKSKSRADPRSNHPAIQAYKTTVGRFPPKPIYPEIITTVGDSPDLARMAGCYREWVSRGYNPNSAKWLLDWYTIGIPSQRRNNARPAGPPAVEITENMAEHTRQLVQAARQAKREVHGGNYDDTY